MNKNRQFLLVAIIAAAATVLVYVPVLWNGFINYDDDVYVTANPPVLKGLTVPGVRYAFTFSAGNWHPVTWLSHMLDVALFGLNPAGHHLTSLILHTVATVLLYAFLAQTTGAVWRSLTVALLFALHPLHVESVAWIAERKDVLCGCFWFVTLLAYAGYVRAPSLRRYLVVLIAFVLALMAKPMAMTLPLVLLLLDFWPLHRFSAPSRSTAKKKGAAMATEPLISWGRLVSEKAPLFLLAAASFVVTYLAQHTQGVVAHTSVILNAGNALISYVIYLCKMLYPTGLAVIYPFASAEITLTRAAAAAIFLLLVTLLSLWQWKRVPYVTVGWLWYLATLLPVIGFVRIGYQAFADRYTYIPFVGLFVALVWGAADLAARRTQWQRFLPLLTIFILAVLSFCTYTQIRLWHDSVTLFRHALAETTDNHIAHNNLGLALLGEGKIAEAIDHLRESVRIRPDFPEVHYNLGIALAQVGQLQEAIGHYRQALQLRPDFPDAHSNLGTALAQSGQLQDAIGHYQEALRLTPDDPEVHYNLGVVLAQTGQLPEAIGHYQQALRLKPNYPEVLDHLRLLGRQVKPANQKQ